MSRRTTVRQILRVLVLLAVLPGPAIVLAHPVAQGAMDVLVLRDRVEIRARVSVEEALVAEGFSKAATEGGVEAIWLRHGAYLLQHLHLEADGTPLAGRLIHVTAPRSTAPDEHIGYELSYFLPTTPRLIRLRQDVLNEYEFAPGNPWEATFVASLGQEGHPAQSGLLLTRKAPLELGCDWTSPATSGAPRWDHGRMFSSYFRHGLQHILAGYDHLLFMAGLILAVTSLPDLVKVLTAFTLAHTVTLTLSVLNILRLPSHIVEPMIAASILCVALQNIVAPRQSRGWTRLAVAFVFGLFHGLGFAGGLLDAMEGLPGVAVSTALIAFSLGVEIGHQIVGLPLFGVLALFRRQRPPDLDAPPLPVVRFGSAVVGLAGMFYLFAALR